MRSAERARRLALATPRHALRASWLPVWLVVLELSGVVTAWYLRQSGHWGSASLITALVAPLLAGALETQAATPLCVLAVLIQTCLWVALCARWRSNGIGAVDLLVLLGLAVLAIPHVRHEVFFAGERSRSFTCDNVYVALNGEVANELDAALHGAPGRPCSGDDPAAIARCIVTEHFDEDNPLDEKQHAYTLDTPVACQVQLAPLSTNGVMFSQIPRPGAPARSFAIRVD